MSAADSVYCTIFDAAYLARALALHSSLLEANSRSRFVFVCMDVLSAELLGKLRLERATVMPYEKFGTPALDSVRPSRSRGEFCWTCKPFALLHLARVLPQADWLVYVDTDMMFFDDPDLALPGPKAHYLLAPHRFHPAFAEYAVTAGTHNAGYVAMRNTSEGRSAIEWWGERCLESCSVVMTETTYADQRYLDRMPALFPFGESSAHAGLDAAPWNIERYDVTGGAAENAGVRLDDAPLLLYHFQSLRILNGWLVDLYAGNRRLPETVRRLIYGPYLRRLAAAYQLLRSIEGAPAPEAQLRAARDWLRLGAGLARGNFNLSLQRIAS
jgi:hypothetical protein